MFINNTSLAELLQSQVILNFLRTNCDLNTVEIKKGYSKSLIPVLVKGVPSMHICLDFVPKLLTNGDLKKQVTYKNFP